MESEKSILLVDDDTDFLRVAGAILKRAGYAVDTAAAAGEAKELAAARTYNAAVLDISLPDTPGTELLGFLIGAYPDLLAIMLTGHSSLQNAVQSLNRGAFAYLEKPLAPDQLLSVIKRGLEKQSLVLENRRLIGELELRNRETGILLSISQAVARSLDLDNILVSALGTLNQLIGADVSYIYVSEDGKLSFRGNCGLSSTDFAARLPLEAPEGLFLTTQPLVLNGDAAALKGLVPEGYASHVVVPLSIAGSPIGILGISTLNAREFSQRELDLFCSTGREIAIAIRNSQLYEEASSARALRELDAARKELLANVSHELRTPLSIIKGYASTMLQPDVFFDTPTIRGFLECIDRESDRLARLIGDLLLMSRLDAGAFEMQMGLCTIAEVLESIHDRLRVLSNSHELSLDLPGPLPPVRADRGRLGEVLSNLVENAARCSPADTGIHVSARRDEDRLIVSVSDKGTGIPPEFHEKIFERFYQLGEPRKMERGNGLGLCICRGIIEAHGGRIWVESEPEKGATFSFSLPLTGEKA